MNPRPLRPESADGGAVICSVLMCSAVLRDLRGEHLLCFGVVWCGFGQGVRGVVSWECPENGKGCCTYLQMMTLSIISTASSRWCLNTDNRFLRVYFILRLVKR